MNNRQNEGISHVGKPTHALPRRYAEPILYLADRMSSMDRLRDLAEGRAVEELAGAIADQNYRKQRWFRDLNDERACRMLDLETAKKGALVVLTYVLKHDTSGGENARGYFTRVRTLLNAEPIAVPSDLNEHRKLALRFITG